MPCSWAQQTGLVKETVTGRDFRGMPQIFIIYLSQECFNPLSPQVTALAPCCRSHQVQDCRAVTGIAPSYLRVVVKP